MLEQHLPAMTKWVEYLRAHSTNLIRDKDRGNDYGDWLLIGADTPKDLIGTAYFAYSTHLLAKSYRALDWESEAKLYEQLFAAIKVAFDKRYVAADGRIQGNTQCGYAMALKFELLPDEHGLLLQDTFPSWLFSVKQGATTIWERWDGWAPEKGFQDPGMNSFNHYSLGLCGEYLFGGFGGIRAASPGFKTIRIEPIIRDGLTWAKTSYDSINGKITTTWQREGQRLTQEVVVPANTTATVWLPAREVARVTESGKSVAKAEGVNFLRLENGNACFEVGSGTYTFVADECRLGIMSA